MKQKYKKEGMSFKCFHNRHLWFGKSVILGRLSKQKFDLSKPCSWCSNRCRKPAWPPHSQPNPITTKKRQFEFLKKGHYSTQQTFHTFDLQKCQTVSYYGTKRPCCVFLCCASALCTLTAVKRIEKWPPELQRFVWILQHVLQYFYMLQFCTNEYSMLITTFNHRMRPAAALWTSK